MADIITTAEYAAATGSSATDPRLPSLITNASAVIKTYTGRNIGDPAVTGTRTYEYDGSGFVEIDDAGAITAVSIDGSALTIGRDVLLEPYAGPVYTWLELYRIGRRSVSPEMGFTYNLDQLWPFVEQRPIVSVTGTFGWPTIPDDIKQAAIWTVQSWYDENEGDLSSEGIESYSRSWAIPGAVAERRAIPNRALDILAPYRRVAAI